jgi:hypothetical protein
MINATALITQNTVKIQTSSLLSDPLEQFDVLSLAVPYFGGGFTNLSLLLLLNVLLMGA